jgi:adenylate kinase family enzyme
MPMLGFTDALPHAPSRILVTGPSGVGKTFLIKRIAEHIDVPWCELDSLYHGPGWTPREEFVADVERFAAQPAWVTEWGYRAVRALLARRGELLIWLDHPRRTVMRRVIWRTVTRRLRRVELWNGNKEGPLWTFFTDRDHIVRWAWQVYGRYATDVPALLADPGGEHLTVVRLRGQRQVDAWLAGPFATATRVTRPSREVPSPSQPPEE